MTGDLTFDHGEWNDEVYSWVKSQGWSHWDNAKRYSAMRWNTHILFLLIHNDYTKDYYKKGETWVEVSTLADYSFLKRGAFKSLDKKQRKMVRDFGIYKAGTYIFDTLGLDGLYGVIEEDNGTVYKITDRINGIKKVKIDKTTSGGVQLYHWQFPRSDWEESFIQNRALTAALDI